MATSEQGDLLEIIIAHFGGYDMKLGIRVAHSETIKQPDTYTRNAQIVAGSHVHVHVHNHNHLISVIDLSNLRTKMYI